VRIVREEGAHRNGQYIALSQSKLTSETARCLFGRGGYCGVVPASQSTARCDHIEFSFFSIEYDNHTRNQSQGCGVPGARNPLSCIPKITLLYIQVWALQVWHAQDFDILCDVSSVKRKPHSKFLASSFPHSRAYRRASLSQPLHKNHQESEWHQFQYLPMSQSASSTSPNRR